EGRIRPHICRRTGRVELPQRKPEADLRTRTWAAGEDLGGQPPNRVGFSGVECRRFGRHSICWSRKRQRINSPSGRPCNSRPLLAKITAKRVATSCSTAPRNGQHAAIQDQERDGRARASRSRRLARPPMTSEESDIGQRSK